LRDSGGFSLIEVLAALFILGVAAATVLGVFSTNLRVIKKSGDHTMATIHARSLLDEALCMDDITEAEDGGIKLDEIYEGSIEVESLGEGEGGVEMHEVRVRVEWPPSGSVVLTGRKAVVKFE
jgi:general secretion pathway protein I